MEFQCIPSILGGMLSNPRKRKKYVHTWCERGDLEDFLGVVFSVLEEHGFGVMLSGSANNIAGEVSDGYLLIVS